MKDTTTAASIHAILSASSLQDAWRVLCSEMDQYGFDRLLYGRTYFARGEYLGDVKDYMALSNHDPEYFDFLIRSGRFKKSPFFIWSFENSGFVSWSHLNQVAIPENVKEIAYKLVQQNQAFGVHAGYTASFENCFVGQKSTASICARRDITQSEVDSIWTKNRMDLESIWLAFDYKTRGLPFPTVEHRLTPKQLEVLQWTAQGKTAPEVAIILGVSQSNVEKHLRLARNSLNVMTSTQAIAKLAFLNQLFVEAESESRIQHGIHGPSYKLSAD